MRHVDPDDLRVAALVLQGERDRAGADADVEHARRRDAFEQRERALDDDLRLRAWHERARIRLEGQAAEAPLAKHVGERLTLLAPGEQRLQRAVDLAVEVGVDAGACRAEHVCEQKLGVDARRVDARGCEPPLRRGESLARVHSPSARRRSSVVSASVNSSSSPWRILSS